MRKFFLILLIFPFCASAQSPMFKLISKKSSTVCIPDADAQKFIDSAGITGIEATAICNLVAGLKADGLWTKMKAVYPFVGGTASSHKWNLKDPRDLDAAFRLTFSGGWTHSSTGALPNGISGFAETNLNPFTALTNNNYHLSHYSRTQQTNTNAVDVGCVESGNAKMIAIDQYYAGVTGKATVLGDYNNYVIIFNNTNTLGFMVGSRTTQTNAKMYFNGVQNGSTLTTSNTNTLPNNTLYIGANHGGYYSVEYSAKECAFASIGDGLNDTEQSNLYTRVQAFQTTLIRQL